eukprot:2542212-Rhodomonas_salina.1
MLSVREGTVVGEVRRGREVREMDPTAGGVGCVGGRRRLGVRWRSKGARVVGHLVRGDAVRLEGFCGRGNEGRNVVGRCDNRIR